MWNRNRTESCIFFFFFLWKSFSETRLKVQIRGIEEKADNELAGTSWINFTAAARRDSDLYRGNSLSKIFGFSHGLCESFGEDVVKIV